MNATPLRKPSRDKILDAAEVLFARRGFQGVGLAEVAEAADLSKSSLFHHFSSKAQLYAAVIARIMARIEDVLMRSLADGGTPATRLERWLEVLIDVLAAEPAYPRLLLRSLFEDDELTGDLAEEREAREHIAHILAAGARLLREGIDTGTFRPVHPEHTLQSLIGMTIYHFASGDLGDELIGHSIFSPAEVQRRKHEVTTFVRHALAAADDTQRRIRS